MKFYFFAKDIAKQILCALLTAQLVLMPSLHFARAANNTATTNNTANATDTAVTADGSGGEQDFPPWLEDLRDRFGFVANGLKLLTEAVDLDRIVGNDPKGNNPWTLRRDTAAQIRLLHVKLQAGTAGYLSGNIGKIITEDHFFSADDQKAQPVQLYTNKSLSADFSLTDDMMKTLMNSVILNQLRKFLSEEQMIDFAVYLITKAPFFPKQDSPGAWEYWQVIKHKIVYYDIYLVLIVAATALFFDKAQLQVSGYLFKLKGDTFRIGWYGGVKNFGAHLKSAEFKAGIKARSETLEARLGFIKKLEPRERAVIEAQLVSKVLSQLIKPKGWGSEANVSINHYLSDQMSPSNQGQTYFSVNSTIKNDKLREEGKSLSLSLQNSVSISSTGRPGIGAAGVISDEKYGVDLSFNVSASPVTVNDRNRYNLQAGFLGSYQWDGGAKGLKNSITADANAIRTALYKIEELTQQEETRLTKMNLVSFRTSLKTAYNSYLEKVKIMQEMLHPNERYYPLTDAEIAQAIIQIEKNNEPIEDDKTRLLMERLYFHN